jgi:hypothetical protein
MFLPYQNISQKSKFLLAFCGMALSDEQKAVPTSGRIIFGDRLSSINIQLTSLIKAAIKIEKDIVKVMELQAAPSLFANKLTKKNKLLLAFASLVLSEAFRYEIFNGKTIYGDDFPKSKVNIPLLIRDVRKINGKIAKLIASESPPEIILNRHCPECNSCEK